MTQLGEIAQVVPREVWPHEASDFTPWLAKPENLGQLGNALGLDLQLVNTEVAVGPYSADIVAQETSSGDYVVIENQLAKTDHDHLGKVLTYAAALDARHVVWLAPRFTDEHQEALHWLNRHTGDDLSFYGVRLEVWKIDASLPAVRFAVHARPSGFRPTKIIGTTRGELSDVKKLQLEFWECFRASLLASGRLPSVRSARAAYWYNIALGRTGVALSCIADTWGNRIGVRVYLRGRYGAEEAIEQLRADQQPIEAELGFPLVWDPNPEKSDRTIAAERPADLDNRDSWEGHIQWMTETALKMREVFAPRVRALDLSKLADSDFDED